MPARRCRLEFDPIVGDDLTAIQRWIVGTHDLPAEPAFHDTSVITFLALTEGGRTMTPHVGDAGHAARSVKAPGARPDEIARVETTVIAVLIENRHQSLNHNRTVQSPGRL